MTISLSHPGGIFLEEAIFDIANHLNRGAALIAVAFY
jgi:hypothetical protein